MIDIKVPAVGESISEVTLLKWVKPDGAYVERDEVIAELESEKATFEVNAEKAGILKTEAKEGDTITIGSVLATIDEQAAKPADTAVVAPSANEKPEEKGAPAASKPVEEAKAAGKGKIEVKVPVVGESISEVTLLKWAKSNGDLVRRDEVIAELESEKATFELNAEEAGQLATSVKEGDTIKIGDVIAVIDTDIAVPAEQAAAPQKTTVAEAKPAAQPAATHASDVKATPVAAAIIADKKIDPATITASGTAGRIVKGDVLAALANPGKKAFDGQELFTRNVRTQKMTNLRKTISRRLVESKNTTAMLTTFNEVDMTRIMEARKAYKDKFKETHGVGLGFMSFFAKACAIALSEWPAVNANLDGDELVYHDYADISIAVSTPRGLTVPVIRNVESLSMADIEKKVIELANKARDNKLSMEELQGGTFTITNGGVFGSLMSTPIINLPQAAILGMHKIQERAMVINGQVVIKPMMYVALSYDHRIIDGRESVSFLVRVKELLESPELLLLGKDPVKTLLEL
ncbi:2-oxoglutarate dehydrogenase complex dihydrolipoyllysine-residue succinyltransferase [Agriterribacter sp.]|uniref:2-oxoglutarate dehydrogenase complex dihydrolipoyllysine-residue succinyltransferase n=1 Tax=Agriterribacter sp. TaxID=2821509 RepID=UPI002BFB7BF9|nr:2-oxoglutarate dehydrogenase complex dihydrolipoyllysine-residue succinyltransferase [Agriterribacter sp.]HRO44429.1 2-oxoglutarate dehydrogenase complex dihydrolipoyllysine-residue succinyltransferase [Agriterribacter sp.]HRQ19216.1 2-oxoglutarate dehydrogenase complex dihydrolipoyllysine-residue succinyltransferase [Agriterribacter sp.]